MKTQYSKKTEAKLLPYGWYWCYIDEILVLVNKNGRVISALNTNTMNCADFYRTVITLSSNAERDKNIIEIFIKKYNNKSFEEDIEFYKITKEKSILFNPNEIVETA